MNNKPIETERLLLRELWPSDDKDMFELDSNSEVHKYLGKNPVIHIEQSQELISMVRNQYQANGIGRWATIEKETGLFIGWSGLKFITEPENNRVDSTILDIDLCLNFGVKVMRQKQPRHA